MSRRDLVASKYLLAVVLAAVGAIAAFAMGVIMGLFHHDLVLEELGLSTVISVGGGLLIVAILLPLIFKFGVEKSRLMLIGVVLIPLGLVYLLKWLLDSPAGFQHPDDPGLAGALGRAPLSGDSPILYRWPSSNGKSFDFLCVPPIIEAYYRR